MIQMVEVIQRMEYKETNIALDRGTVIMRNTLKKKKTSKYLWINELDGVQLNWKEMFGCNIIEASKEAGSRRNC